MKALWLDAPDRIHSGPLRLDELATPDPGRGELRIRIQACGICHTDLHTVEGDINPPSLPIIPGHQVVGVVEAIGEDVTGWSIGDLAGVPWLYRSCGRCDFCRRGEENLCIDAQFTGFDRNGGYAEAMISQADFTLRIPSGLDAEGAAPLLCAGIIGYRSLRKADVQPGEKVGLVGFGASAHLAIQVARGWDCEVFVFTRSHQHRELARELGACWVGGSDDDPPVALDRAVIFAPAGNLVPPTLARIRRGGTVAINAIHMSPIPEMEYDLIYGERTLRSVANATYVDGLEFLKLAVEMKIETKTTAYPLEDANRALQDLKDSRINGAGVLIP